MVGNNAVDKISYPHRIFEPKCSKGNDAFICPKVIFAGIGVIGGTLDIAEGSFLLYDKII